MTVLQQHEEHGEHEEQEWFEEQVVFAPTEPEVRRQTGRVRRESVYAVLGAQMAAISLTELVSNWLVPFTGHFSFVVVSFVFFVIAYGFLISLTESGQAVRDRLASLLTYSATSLVFFLMGWVIFFPLWNGRNALFHWNFYSQDLHTTGPLDPINVGGLQYAVIGTIEQITITLVITVPLGIACGLFLNEVPGRLAHLVRTVAAAATALPSVVAGLFIYALAILQFGLPFSGFAAGLALSIMTLPIIIRASDVVFRLVPAGLKEASYALGASRWRTASRVTLPTARSGLATAVILGAARGIGETSPVLLTAGYTTYTNYNPFSLAQTSLPLATYKLVTSDVPNYVSRGYAAAGLLFVLVLILFALARVVGGRPAGQLSNGQRRRRAVASAALATRYREAAQAQEEQALEEQGLEEQEHEEQGHETEAELGHQPQHEPRRDPDPAGEGTPGEAPYGNPYSSPHNSNRYSNTSGNPFDHPAQDPAAGEETPTTDKNWEQP